MTPSTQEWIKQQFKEGQSKLNMVENPPHYNHAGIECIEAIEAALTPEEFKGYLKGNVMKYISRAGKKDATLQELNKAKTYLQWLCEVEETGKLQEVPTYG